MRMKKKAAGCVQEEAAITILLNKIIKQKAAKTKTVECDTNAIA